MRRQEAEQIGQIVKSFKFQTVINIGAGNVTKQQKNKPWIKDCIFDVLTDQGSKIVHTDLFKFDGIDVTADFTEDTVNETFSAFHGPRLFLLCNVLEHIPTPLIQKICDNVKKCLFHDDALVISVPFDYPFHADPIDTMFRPSPQDLAALFNKKWEFSDVIEAGSYREELQEMHWSKALRKLTKPLWFLQSPTRYHENISRLKYLLKPYKVTIVMTMGSSSNSN